MYPQDLYAESPAPNMIDGAFGRESVLEELIRVGPLSQGISAPIRQTPESLLFPPCEDTASRQTSTSQKEKLHQTSAMLTP